MEVKFQNKFMKRITDGLTLRFGFFTGYVNNFLSWKIFIPLGRLTYVVYLIHLNYLTVFHAFTRQPYYYTKFNHTEHYFGTILMVFFMAFVICLTVEVPFLNLERLILPSRTSNFGKR